MRQNGYFLLIPLLVLLELDVPGDNQEVKGRFIFSLRDLDLLSLRLDCQMYISVNPLSVSDSEGLILPTLGTYL